jgi:hypothetical protein
MLLLVIVLTIALFVIGFGSLCTPPTDSQTMAEDLSGKRSGQSSRGAKKQRRGKRSRRTRGASYESIDRLEMEVLGGDADSEEEDDGEQRPPIVKPKARRVASRSTPPRREGEVATAPAEYAVRAMGPWSDEQDLAQEVRDANEAYDRLSGVSEPGGPVSAV